jgi:hypothetical protein
MRKKQIKVRIIGGLGNQLFVYFAGLYLSQISGRTLIMDMKDTSRVHSSYDLRSFREISEIQVINENKPRKQLLSKIIDSLRYRFPVIANFSDSLIGNYSDEGYQENVMRLSSQKRTIKFSGYFQDFRYLNNLESFKLTLKSAIPAHSEMQEKNVLAIHVRRGDFLNEKKTHGCLESSWYYKAVSNQFERNPEITKIKIFSNDTEWIVSNLESICPKTEIEIEVVPFDALQDPAESFMEFAHSKYRVCSNSTYSLLAAYIVSGDTVVPFPYNRTGNFKALEESSPSSWVRIPSIWEE